MQRIVSRLLARELTNEQIGRASGSGVTLSSGLVTIDTWSTRLTTVDGCVFQTYDQDDTETEVVWYESDFEG